MMRISICDDEAPTRAYLTSLIRAQDCPCEVVEYASASDCLADHRGIDLLFLDIELNATGPDGMAAGPSDQGTVSRDTAGHYLCDRL